MAVLNFLLYYRITAIPGINIEGNLFSGLLVFKTMDRCWNPASPINKTTTVKLVYWHYWRMA